MVHLTGKGLGGRNQEIARWARPRASPDAATVRVLLRLRRVRRSHGCGRRHCGRRLRRAPDRRQAGLHKVLQDNDAYHALKAIDGLIVTGPTGTNVNDLSVVLIKR